MSTSHLGSFLKAWYQQMTKNIRLFVIQVSLQWRWKKFKSRWRKTEGRRMTGTGKKGKASEKWKVILPVHSLFFFFFPCVVYKKWCDEISKKLQRRLPYTCLSGPQHHYRHHRRTLPYLLWQLIQWQPLLQETHTPAFHSYTHTMHRAILTALANLQQLPPTPRGPSSSRPRVCGGRGMIATIAIFCNV